MTVQVVQHDAVAWVELSAPHQNAINAAMWREITSTFLELSADQSLRAVVVFGSQGHFAAGAEIGEFPQLRHDLQSVRYYHEHTIAPALHALKHCNHPVIAKIRGSCVGGGLEIASCCDLRYASSNAVFGVPIGRLGFAMAPDEMVGLLGLAGPALTIELLLEGRLLDAQEAAARGLVNRVVEDTQLDAAVADALTRIGQGAPLAARVNKRLLRALLRGPLSDVDRLHAFSYAESADHHEGVAAFLAHRAPIFDGT